MAAPRIQVNLRLQPGMRDQLQAAADRNGVSMTKEITDRLEASFKAKPFDGLQISEQAARLAGAIAIAMDYAGWQAAYFLSFGKLMKEKKDAGVDIAHRGVTVGEVNRIYSEAKANWLGQPWPYRQAQFAAARLLELLAPDHVADVTSKGVHVDIGTRLATDLVSEIIHGPARPESQLEIERVTKFRELIGDHVAEKLKHDGPLLEILEAARRERLGIAEDKS